MRRIVGRVDHGFIMMRGRYVKQVCKENKACQVFRVSKQEKCGATGSRRGAGVIQRLAQGPEARERRKGQRMAQRPENGAKAREWRKGQRMAQRPMNGARARE